MTYFESIAIYGTCALYHHFRETTDMADARDRLVLTLRAFANEIEVQSVDAGTGRRFIEPESASQDDGQVIE